MKSFFSETIDNRAFFRIFAYSSLRDKKRDRVVEWKEIEGYAGYMVSDTGIVKSEDRFIEVVGGRGRRVIGKVLKPKINKDGYAVVSLSIDKGKKYFYVHRLIGLAFVPNPNCLPELNHVSGNKLENTTSNLQWVSHAENVQHAYDTGLNKNQQGEHHKAVAILDKILGKTFETIKAWCAARGISYSAGKNFLSGHRYSKGIDLAQIVRLSPM